jgi:hypothetical protein
MICKAFFTVFLILGGFQNPENPSQSDPVTRALQADQIAKDPEHPLQRIEVSPFQGVPNVFVAIRDWQERWWGDFVVFCFEDGRIVWTASMTEEPDEQSILIVKGVRLAGFSRPFIEVFGKTHMGNGNYYLYEICGGALRLVLKTHAVDCHWADNNLIRGEHLNPTYRDLNGDGYSDVELIGVVEQFSPDDDVDPVLCFQVNPCRKVFHWNPAQDRFVEDRSQRIGFECYGPLDY